MSSGIFFKSDYRFPPRHSRETYGEFIYEIIGGEKLENFFKIIPVKPGLMLSFSNSFALGCSAIDFQVGTSPIDFSFCLAGSSRHKYRGIGGKGVFEFVPKPGMMVISSLSNVAGSMELSSGKTMTCVGLKIDPALLFSYLEPDMDRVNKAIKSLLHDQGKNRLIPCRMSPEMQRTAWQIINSPFKGNAGKLFHESRALELLSQQIEAICLGKVELYEKKNNLSKTDLDHIYTARDILLKDLQNPPTIAKLARLAGINEFKLKKGFKQTFNTTIFSYLQKIKMKKAEEMIRDMDITITEIASEIGYCNVSHFIAAYRKEFGINPGSFKKSIRRHIRT